MEPGSRPGDWGNSDVTMKQENLRGGMKAEGASYGDQ
jgi:hypothetical protein